MVNDHTHVGSVLLCLSCDDESLFLERDATLPPLIVVLASTARGASISILSWHKLTRKQLSVDYIRLYNKL